jgi:hypothetical protein
VSKKPISHDPNFWATAKAIKSLNEQKLCLAESRADACEGQIIKAHTIPRSQLERIAVNGHVYAMKGDLPTFEKTGGKIEITKQGIGSFSRLNCFCAKHDVKLFSCVENQSITGTPEQVAALHYRAIGAELYRKVVGISPFEQIVEQLSNVRSAADRAKLLFAEAHITGTKLGIADVGKTFVRCENAIFNEKYDDVGALIVRFKNPPSIMCVGAFFPEFDFLGRRLQSLADLSLDDVSLSILTADGKAIVILAWLKPSNISKRFSETFIAQPANLLSTLLIQVAFEHLENSCANMIWWDAMKDVERNSLIGRMQHTLDSLEPLQGPYLAFGGIKFDDWQYDDHFFVNP